MYELLDKPSAIREVQKFLHVLADRTNTDIPRVTIDGIYDQNTSNSVRYFQAVYGIEPTGSVDRKTFDLLFLMYNDAMEESNTKQHLITDNGFPIRIGSHNSDVTVIHAYLNELNKTYPIGSSPKGGYFSLESQNATSNLQRIFNLDPTGEIDALLFKRIVDEIDSIRRIEEKYT